MTKAIKPRLARGTRDFLPSDMVLRNHILNTVRKQFELFRFEQIETPAVENLETLTGKYGEEGDKLIFKILNSGDYLKKIGDKELSNYDAKSLLPEISDKALRYDLTVPFARFVVQHQNDISFPFRRYQIQPVWRADRPAKGRYREFYQCDADIIGSDSLMLEAELIDLIKRIFSDLNISITIKVNSRKLLYGFCEKQNIQNQFTEFTTILDKIDKKPWEDLNQDFIQSGFSEELIHHTKDFIDHSGSVLSMESIDVIAKKVEGSQIGTEGVKEMQEIASLVDITGNDGVVLDLSLARGLNYYTGAIIEVIANDFQIGSVCGGGRYDDLTSMFGLPDVSGIGISFGIDRIYDILKGESASSTMSSGIKVLFVNFGSDEIPYALKAVSEIRDAGITIDLYPDAHKMKKQFRYADQIGVSHVIIAGKEEMEKSIFKLKNLESGDQKDYKMDDLINHLRQ